MVGEGPPTIASPRTSLVNMATVVVAMLEILYVCIFFCCLNCWTAIALTVLGSLTFGFWVWGCRRFNYINARELHIWLHIAGDLRQILPLITEDNKNTAPLLTVGPGFDRILGYQPGEMEGRPWTDFVHPDDLLIESGGSDRMVADGQIQSYSNRWRHKQLNDDGSTRWVWLEWNALSDAELGYTYACGRDTTIQFQREGQMATWSRITNDLMAMTTADPSIPVRERRFDWVNEAWPRLLGLSVAEVYNTKLEDLIHPDDIDRITLHRQDVESGLEPQVMECRIRCRGGRFGESYRLYEWGSISLNGRLYLTGRDVGVEKVHRREMAKAISNLESRNEDLERFASVAAHQLRSPPRTITGIAQALAEDYGDLLDEDGRQFLEDIRNDANQMADIVDGLFRFSKVRTSDDMHIEPVDIELVMQKVKEKRAKKRCSACKNGPTCPHINNHDCPDKRETIKFKNLPTVLGDRLLLGEVFSNLIENGMKFNESKEKWVEVLADPLPNGKWAISVVDNGIGIDPQYHGKLFTMFQRVHPQYMGTGVGLALVAAIINKLGGTIQVESDVDVGATFSFDLKGAWTAENPGH